MAEPAAAPAQLKAPVPATADAPEPPVAGWAATAGRYAVLGEVVVAISAALVSVQLSRGIDVNPLDRIGQVSGLAALELRFMVLGLVVLSAALVAAQLRRRAAFALVCQLACAAVAGLATGLMAGGLVLALRGTTWPLYASWGDAGTLAAWADNLVAGGSMPADYPPVAVHLIAWWAEFTSTSASGALRTLQVVGTALFGPVAYLSWRLLLRPVWALGIGLVAALPLIDLYKPYTNVVLVALVPLVIVFLRLLRRAATASWVRLALSGTGVGAAAGLLFLTYSGWFVWSAIGVCAAALIVFPWRAGPLRGLALLAVTGAAFLVVTTRHLLGVLRAAGQTRDTYFYFDTYVEPAYIAMWRNDLPGDTGPWPPPGELAGVGLFTVLLVIGLGAAIALAGRSTVVITLSCCLLSAWLMRFWLAARMYATQSVQLYPRTTPEILYCLLLLSGFAVYFAIRRWRQLPQPVDDQPVDGQRVDGQRVDGRGAYVAIGTLSAVLLFALFAGSATVDRYLPRGDNSTGALAYMSQMVRQPDGRCPAYSRPDKCARDPAELIEWLNNGR